MQWLSQVSKLPLCCSMTLTEVSELPWAVQWLSQRFLTKAFPRISSPLGLGENYCQGNVLLNWGGFDSRTSPIWIKPFPSRTRMYFTTLFFFFFFNLGTILPSHIMGPKWPVKCLLIAARFRKGKNRPVQQGSPGALVLRRAQWRSSNAKRALLPEHQITGITF